MPVPRDPQIRRLAKKLGVAESTIRARRSRGQRIDAPRQLRLTKAQMYRIARAPGSTTQVGRKYGCSPSTVKRLRHVYGTAASRS